MDILIGAAEVWSLNKKHVVTFLYLIQKHVMNSQTHQKSQILPTAELY